MKTGVYKRTELMAMGLTIYGIRKRVKEGILILLRKGWYATDAALEPVSRAVQLGGTLCRVSGCQVRGIWTPQGAGLHVAARERLTKTPRDVHTHIYHSDSAAVAPLLDCLSQALRYHDPETGLILLESAVNKNLISTTEAEHLISLAPQRAQSKLKRFSPTAQSGSETRVRMFLQGLGVPVAPQFYIPGVGRVDMLVGDSLIVECDSFAHHDKGQDYVRDRQRDVESYKRGCQRIRLSYPQIWTEWEDTQHVLGTSISRGYHRRPLHPL